MRHSLIFLFLSIFLIASCGDDKPSRTIDRTNIGSSKPPLRVELDSKGPISYGDTLKISVSSIRPEFKVRQVTVSLVNGPELIASSTDSVLALPTQLTGGGDIRLEIKAVLSDGQTSSRYKEIRVLANQAPESFNLEVVNRYPHDTKSYTQGLLVYEGYLYEGTGNYGESRLRKMELSTGKVLREKEIESDYFGEGITIFNNKIYQLTYKSTLAFVYDLETFDRLEEFRFTPLTGEGWGLTSNDTVLIASDGSSYLYYLDPLTFREIKRISVFDDRGSVDNLNELEFRDGIIYANVYTTAQIVAIDAGTGSVKEIYTARGLVQQNEVTANMDVLNGIALNPFNGNLLITGKYWSRIYEVKPVRSDT